MRQTKLSCEPVNTVHVSSLIERIFYSFLALAKQTTAPEKKNSWELFYQKASTIM